MSTISGVSASNGSDPWAAMKAQRSQMQAKMFAKVDTDGNGSVNQSELGSMLDTISQKTGATFDDAAKVFSAMDSNADGSLSSDELGKGMKSLMPPPPPSTMDFAQTRSNSGNPSTGSADDDLFSKVDSDGSGGVSNDELQALFDKMASHSGASSTSDPSASDVFSKLDTNGDGALTQTEFDAGRPQGPQGSQGMQGAGGMPPPPPGGGGGGGPAGAGGSSASSSTYDPLDTNQDGTVSLAERLAESTKSDPVQALFKAMDANSDGEVSKTETDAFSQKLSDLVAQSANSSESTVSSKTPKQGFDVARLAQMLYDQVASGLSSASQSNTLSTVA